MLNKQQEYLLRALQKLTTSAQKLCNESPQVQDSLSRVLEEEFPKEKKQFFRNGELDLARLGAKGIENIFAEALKESVDVLNQGMKDTNNSGGASDPNIAQKTGGADAKEVFEDALKKYYLISRYADGDTKFMEPDSAEDVQADMFQLINDRRQYQTDPDNIFAPHGLLAFLENKSNPELVKEYLENLALVVALSLQSGPTKEVPIIKDEAARWQKQFRTLATESGVQMRTLTEIVSDHLKNPESHLSFAETGNVSGAIDQVALEQVMKQVNKMVGLESVKERMHELINLAKIRDKRGEAGLPADYSDMSFNAVFHGAIGVGKEELANDLWPKFLVALGFKTNSAVQKISHIDLMTAQGPGAVSQGFASAKDGILLIENVSKLKSHPMGALCLGMLLDQMKDNPDVAVVFTDDGDAWSSLKEIDENVRNKFQWDFNCPDYTPDQLELLFDRIKDKKGYTIDGKSREKLQSYIREKWERRDKTFGNSIFVKDTFQGMIARHANRVVPLEKERELTFDDLEGFLGVDVEEPFEVNQAALKTALDDLHRLEGLDEVKDQVQFIADWAENAQTRREAGLKVKRISLHMAFKGNPGTGKTEVAKIIARIYNALGLLKGTEVTEVTATSLKGQFVGHTEKNTRDALERAKPGAIVLDEFDNLTGQYGEDAISVLVPYMENSRDELAVILTGYPKNLTKVIESNPGLKDRLKWTLAFEDYNPEQLTNIFKKFVDMAEYTIDDDALEKASRMIKKAWRTKDEQFGNARYVRNLFEAMQTRQARRLKEMKAEGKTPTKEDLMQISLADVDDVHVVDEAKLKEAVHKVDRLIGLEHVKEELHTYIPSVKAWQEREARGLPNEEAMPMNFVFAGNPGTGKTTVARDFGEIFKELGLLKRGNVVELDRSKLVGKYVGHTENDTLEYLKEAIGGVLFIDEAYNLADSSGGDFGKKALDTILKFIEDHAGEMVVIFAGYPGPIQQMMKSNPGLASRFNHYIDFEDYDLDQLMDIFEMKISDSHYKADDEAKAAVRKLVESEYNSRGERFGNGRLVRNIADQLKKQHGKRLGAMDYQNASDEELMTFTKDDVKALDLDKIRMDENEGGSFTPPVRPISEHNWDKDEEEKEVITPKPRTRTPLSRPMPN